MCIILYIYISAICHTYDVPCIYIYTGIYVFLIYIHHSSLPSLDSVSSPQLLGEGKGRAGHAAGAYHPPTNRLTPPKQGLQPVKETHLD